METRSPRPPLIADIGLTDCGSPITLTYWTVKSDFVQKSERKRQNRRVNIIQESQTKDSTHSSKSSFPGSWHHVLEGPMHLSASLSRSSISPKRPLPARPIRRSLPRTAALRNAMREAFRETVIEAVT
jgi:hypothetical protein